MKTWNERRALRRLSRQVKGERLYNLRSMDGGYVGVAAQITGFTRGVGVTAFIRIRPLDDASALALTEILLQAEDESDGLLRHLPASLKNDVRALLDFHATAGVPLYLGAIRVELDELPAERAQRLRDGALPPNTRVTRQKGRP